MPNGQMSSDEPAQGLLVEYLGHQAHPGVEADALSVSSGDAGAFLTTVLESE
jgi:hypothetical protein